MRTIPRLGRKSERGQTYSEFIISVPVLFLLLGGIFLAGFYVWRVTASNWGLFVSGVAGGSYDTHAPARASRSIWWSDIRNAVVVEQTGETVRTEISIETPITFFGVTLSDVHRGSNVFHLWRFRPGPRGQP